MNDLTHFYLQLIITRRISQLLISHVNRLYAVYYFLFLPVSVICRYVLDNGMLRNVSYKWHARQNDPSLVLNATLDNATGTLMLNLV